MIKLIRCNEIVLKDRVLYDTFIVGNRPMVQIFHMPSELRLNKVVKIDVYYSKGELVAEITLDDENNSVLTQIGNIKNIIKQDGAAEEGNTRKD